MEGQRDLGAARRGVHELVRGTARRRGRRRRRRGGLPGPPRRRARGRPAPRPPRRPPGRRPRQRAARARARPRHVGPSRGRVDLPRCRRPRPRPPACSPAARPRRGGDRAGRGDVAARSTPTPAGWSPTWATSWATTPGRHPTLAALERRRRCGRDRALPGPDRRGDRRARARSSGPRRRSTPRPRCCGRRGGRATPTVLSYDVDSRDFTDPGAAAIRRTVAAVTAGGVVSLHLGHPGRSTPSRGPRRPRRAAAWPRSPPAPCSLIPKEKSARAAPARPLPSASCWASCWAPCRRADGLSRSRARRPRRPRGARPRRPRRPARSSRPATALPGMPPVTDPHNVYAAAGAGMLSARRGRRSRWSTCRTRSPATSG